MSLDMCVPCGSGVLNIRVGAIIMKDQKILMVGNERTDYLYSVGGRVKFGETAEEAVVREVFEETGVSMEVDRLGFVHENYYYGDVGIKLNKLVYELSYFFYMKVPEHFVPVNESVSDGGCKEFLRWVSLDEAVQMYPDFFRTELKFPVNTVKHIVTDERGKKMLLKTERLTVRRVNAEDWRSIRDIWIDFSKSDFAQYDRPHMTEDEDVKAHIARWAAAENHLDHMYFAVCLEDRVIGYIAANLRSGHYEIGYCFHSAYHGKGYAKESHLALISYLKSLGIRKLSAGTVIQNVPSVKLLNSLGFKQAAREKVSFYKDEQGNDIIFDGGIFELELES